MQLKLHASTRRDRRLVLPGQPGHGRAVTRQEHRALQSALTATRQRMGRHRRPNQYLGNRKSIGCVALEITQRCNLDCTLCYLSEHSEDVRDLPLSEVLKRVDRIADTYGVGTNVQVTGGDPTLRDHDELVRIVAHVRQRGMNPTLFTNGILASRRLLMRLADAGLCDVAFHVDTTQERQRGGRLITDEADLDSVREQYLARAAGLPIRVIFNTTVHNGNLDQIPALVRFFLRHAGQLTTVSFQMQADTGRGEWGKRGPVMTPAGVRKRIALGAGNPLEWNAVAIGHPSCHRYSPCLVLGDRARSIVTDSKLYARWLQDFGDIVVDRRAGPWEQVAPYLRAAGQRPGWFLRAAGYSLGWLWRARRDLLQACGQARHLSFFVQNYMDADHLDQERIDACSFMVMTPEGPQSMCAFNAERDQAITAPLIIEDGGVRYAFDPLADDGPATSHANTTGCGSVSPEASTTCGACS